MKKVFSFLIVIAFVYACKEVAVTGRRQLSFIGDGELNKMSFAQYDQVKAESKVLPDDDDRVLMIRRVGNKIAEAVSVYFDKNNMSNRKSEFAWEFNVIDENTVNAWCMPGGKVAFYTGILPITQDELGVAVVMGHEVAHAIARHGNERMSQGLLANGIMAGASILALLSDKPQLTKDLFLASFGASAQLGMLAFSRKHESEADHMGIIFMAMAGYDPEAAVGFWQRMSAGGGQKPPEFLSTHPSDQRRIDDIKRLLPEAKKYYKP
jgi:predicted Zn-dependent protease